MLPEAEEHRESVVASTFHVLARAFSSPLDMTAESIGVLKEVAGEYNPELRRSALTLAEYWKEALLDKEAFALSYSRLFLGPFKVLSPPYASVYLEGDQKLMGEVSMYVANLYAESGLGPGEGPNEVPDHIALECEFLYYLTYSYVTTGAPSWLEKRDSFLSTHFSVWIPKFVENIIGADESTFYNELARFMTSALTDLFHS